MTNEKIRKEFKEWMAGVIDGNGQIRISKEGEVSLEIVQRAASERSLQEIKQYYGGSIKSRAGGKAVRYRLQDRKGLQAIFTDINGEIRASKRTEQYKAVLKKYSIPYQEAQPLTRKSGWIMGMFDSDGSITGVPHELTIKIQNKHYVNIEPILKTFGGNYVYDKAGTGHHCWYITSVKDLEDFLAYSKEYPSRSIKKERIMMIPEYLNLKAMKADTAPPGTVMHKRWERFEEEFRSRNESQKVKE